MAIGRHDNITYLSDAESKALVNGLTCSGLPKYYHEIINDGADNDAMDTRRRPPSVEASPTSQSEADSPMQQVG